MTTLDQACSPAADGTLAISEGWRQGRGAFGGLTVAAAIRAIEQRVGDRAGDAPRVPRAAPRGALGHRRAARTDRRRDGAVPVDILRSGSSVTVARAALHQNDEVTTHVVAVLGASRSGDLAWRELAMPSAPSWRTVEPLPMSGPGFPEFAQHFEYRLVAGMPFSGAAPTTIGWISPRDPGPPAMRRMSPRSWMHGGRRR